MTGLSADACRSVSLVVDELGLRFDGPSSEFLSDLINNLSTIPEFRNTVLRTMTRPNNRFAVKTSDGASIINQG